MADLSIDDLVYAWTKRRMLWHRQSSNSVLWIATTGQSWDYSKSDYLRKWESRKLREVGVVQVNYDHDAQHLETHKDFADSRMIDNSHGSTPARQTVEYSKEVTNTLEVSVSGGFKLGYEVSGKLELPFVASGGFKQTGEVNFSAGRKTTESVKKTFKISTPVEVPPYHRTVITTTVLMESLEIPFSATLSLSGGIVVQFAKNIPVDKGDPDHRLWLIPIEMLVSDLQAYNYTKWITDQVGSVDLTGYQIMPGGVITHAQGVITADVASSSETVISEYDQHGNLVGPPVSRIDRAALGVDSEHHEGIDKRANGDHECCCRCHA